MRWLHGFLNDIEQVLTQLAQVYLIAQGCAERYHDLGRIVLTAVETAVNDRLDAMAQGLEERRDSECRSNDDHGRLRDLPGEQAHQCPETYHQANVDQSQQDRQRAIHQRAIDQHVDVGAMGVLTVYLLTIHLLRRLPKQGRVSMDGITTIDDAVEACRRTHLQGWDLVAYAQNLAAQKFTYSRLNTWDTPSRAFERGMGYCEQQALALKKIYDKLGIETRPVIAIRCKFPAKVVDGMPSPGGIGGHA